ncbi:prostatic acid phosphatase-like [Macrosteles quadrilineatus]|uniref:prostatic acid phosphatase-like n=1 Tax=Macrosteles quadrilineatus TaxID=74068 RepID=UPI0023E1A584|nr:prostatic acid phosphatase-like [Macrosteles quadrilineatus]
MWKVTRVFVLVALYSYVGSQEYSGSLRLVNVVFRHGQRTPADTYPSDPHLHQTFHPYGWGQLTNEGKRQQYELGEFLRDRYGSFIGDGFPSKVARVQSTGVERTLMSAQLVAAGLFTPSTHPLQQWNQKLDWQPVAVHSQPLEEDSLLLVRIPCPRYHEERDRLKSEGEVKSYLASLSDLYKSLSLHSGLTVSDPDDVQSLYSTLLAEVQFNLTLPEWTKDYYPEKMAKVTAYSFTLNAYNDQLKKLKGGPLLKEIITNMKEKIKEPNGRKMFLYAGHDSTVANILLALNVWDEQIPVYNIMTMIELHQLNGVYGVKVYLRNSTEHEPYHLRVPSCGDFCPLDKLVELSTKVLPENLEKDCLSKDPNYKPPLPSGP